MHGFAKNPSQRYQEPAELLAELAHPAPAARLAPAAAMRPTKVAAGTKLDGRASPVPSLADRIAQEQPSRGAGSSSEGRRVVEGQFAHGTQAVATGNYDYGMMLLLNCCRLEPGNLAFQQALHQAQLSRHGTPGLRP